MMIYHITTHAAWVDSQADGSYRGDTLESQGFIHCSDAGQVAGVANRIFSGRDDLVVLCIDKERLQPAVKWENLEGGEELFPHIYGELNLNAVTGVLDFKPGKDGIFHFPMEMD